MFVVNDVMLTRPCRRVARGDLPRGDHLAQLARLRVAAHGDRIADLEIADVPGAALSVRFVSRSGVTTRPFPRTNELGETAEIVPVVER